MEIRVETSPEHPVEFDRREELYAGDCGEALKAKLEEAGAKVTLK